MKHPGYVTWLALISLASVGCKSSESGNPAAVEPAQARIVESKEVPATATVQATGALRAREAATLFAQVMGRVQQVLVREGDSVKAGQTLVILDDATLRSATEQAQAAVKAAESQQIAAQTSADLAASTLARYKQLQSQKSVSLQEMDEVTRRAEAATAQADALRAQANAAKAQLSGSQAMFNYSRVAAPFAGLITGRMIDPGALASPGVPLIQIDGSGPLQLQATVAESAIGFVHKGMRVGVSIASPGADTAGTVSEILPAADMSSHTFLIKIDLAPAKKSPRRHVCDRGNTNRFKTGDSRAAIRDCDSWFALLCIRARQQQRCTTSIRDARNIARRYG